MNEFLFHAHSGLRYLVLLAGAVAALYFAYGWVARAAFRRPARLMLAVFAGTLDLQIVLGILLVLAGVFYPALIGHIVMMLLAAAFAHGFSIATRRPAAERRRHGLALAGVLLALGSIIAGILAIGRGIFQSGAS